MKKVAMTLLAVGLMAQQSPPAHPSPSVYWVSMQYEKGKDYEQLAAYGTCPTYKLMLPSTNFSPVFIRGCGGIWEVFVYDTDGVYLRNPRCWATRERAEKAGIDSAEGHRLLGNYSNPPQ